MWIIIREENEFIHILRELAVNLANKISFAASNKRSLVITHIIHARSKFQGSEGEARFLNNCINFALCMHTWIAYDQNQL